MEPRRNRSFIIQKLLEEGTKSKQVWSNICRQRRVVIELKLAKWAYSLIEIKHDELFESIVANYSEKEVGRDY